MAKQKVNPVAIALLSAVVLILVGITAKYLVDAYAPSDTEKSMNDLKKNLEEIRKTENNKKSEAAYCYLTFFISRVLTDSARNSN